MNLIFYSGGTGHENRALAGAAVSMLKKKHARITFVPAHKENAREEYRAFIKTFKNLGINHFSCICIDDDSFNKKKEKELFMSDAIFLGGGNTFYFLQQIQKRKLQKKIASFVKNGGVLLGLSAGSIIMTPSISTASVPAIDSDSNDVNLKNWTALGLVPFEFSPHYYSSKSSDSELIEYSKNKDYPIYACADGVGIVVRDGKIQFLGSVTVFHNGLKYTIH